MNSVIVVYHFCCFASFFWEQLEELFCGYWMVGSIFKCNHFIPIAKFSGCENNRRHTSHHCILWEKSNMQEKVLGEDCGVSIDCVLDTLVAFEGSAKRRSIAASLLSITFFLPFFLSFFLYFFISLFLSFFLPFFLSFFLSKAGVRGR